MKALKEDVEEMQRMLEAYMAFVRGDGGERAEPTDVSQLLQLGEYRDGGAATSRSTVDVDDGSDAQGEAQCLPAPDRPISSPMRLRYRQGASRSARDGEIIAA